MPPAAAPPDQKPKKLQRISQACDLCHRRSIRCRPSAENPQQQCQNCFDFGVECTYNRPSKRRRQPANPSQPSPSSSSNQATISLSQRPYRPPPPALVGDQHASSSRGTTSAPLSSHDPALANLSHYTSTADGTVDLTGAFVDVREDRLQQSLGTAWRSFALASASTIEHYLELYMDVVYPLYPVFHPPTLWDRVQKRHHIMDRGFFASITAACALAAARARDGAAGDRFEFDDSPEKSSETFFAAARDACMMDLNRSRNLGFLRACALLAVTSLQYGQIDTMHLFMGHYHTLAATQKFHDEQHWPPKLEVVEKEERRRLYWSMYQFSVYTSVVFDSVVPSEELQSNVRYPVEINDEDLAAGGESPVSRDCWLRGWNFNTDVFRVLEHAVQRMRRHKQAREDRIPLVRLVVAEAAGDTQIMESLLGVYYQLPNRFKEYRTPMTDNARENMFGFQAASIQATLQLVRMTLLSSEAGTVETGQRCAVADQVLIVFRSIAPQYLLAISTPIIYHLGVIGQMLSSVMEGPLSEEYYQRVRALLVSVSEMLTELESGLQSNAGALKDLHKQIQLLDEYMGAQRRMMASGGQQVLRSDLDSRVRGVGPSQMANGIRIHPPLEEYHLPHELVQEGTWPWPFSMAPEQQPQNPNMMFRQ